ADYTFGMTILLEHRPIAGVGSRPRPGRRRSARAAACAVSAVIVAAACSTSAQPARRLAPSDVVATVGTASITLAEVDDKALEQPGPGGVKRAQAPYDARREVLDDLIASRLIDDAAKAQGIERSALVEKEITPRIPAVTDADIVSWYQANQARVQGASLDQ